MLAIALLTLLALLFLFFTPQESQGRMAVEDGFIGSGSYAIAEKTKDGSVLYFGHFDRRPTLAIRSNGRLSNPFIINSTRILIVERTSPTAPNFRLLETKVGEGEVACVRLVESTEYIGNPIVLDHAGSEEFLFLSGDYNPAASGSPVSSYRVSRLKDGKVTFLSGPTFLPLGRLAQIGDTRFIAVATYIQYMNRASIDLSDRNHLVDLQIGESGVEAAPVDLPPGSIGAANLVTSAPKIGLIFVSWTEFQGGRRSYVSVIDYAGKELVGTYPLPKGRDYGAFFAESSVDGRYTARALSVQRVETDRSAVILSEFSDGQLESESEIDLRPEMVLDTESCSPAQSRI